MEGRNQGSAQAARGANLAGGVADNQQASVRVWRSCDDQRSKVIIEISSPPRRLVALSRFVQLLEQQGLHSFDLTVSPNHQTNMHCLRAVVEAQLSAAQLHTLQSILVDQILRSESDIAS